MTGVVEANYMQPLPSPLNQWNESKLTPSLSCEHSELEDGSAQHVEIGHKRELN